MAALTTVATMAVVAAVATTVDVGRWRWPAEAVAGGGRCVERGGSKGAADEADKGGGRKNTPDS